MKKFFLTLLILAPFISFSQDLIINKANDSINCSVIKQSKKNYYYKIANDTNTLKIAVSDVSECIFGYFARLEKREKSKSIIKNISSEELSYKYDFLSINLSANRNFIYKNPERMLLRKMNDNYNKKISSGYCFGGDIAYYMNNYLGIGIRANYFYSSAKEDSLPYTHSFYDSDSILHQENSIGYLSDNIGLLLGEIYIAGKYNFKRSYAYANIGIGMYKFKDTHYDYYIQQISRGQCVAFSLNLGYDIKIIKYIALGINASYTAASLKQISVDNQARTLTKNSTIKLNRLSLGLNLKFWLNKRK